MRKALFFSFLIIFISLPFILKSQINIKFNINADTIEVDKFRFEKPDKGKKLLFLRMNFGAYTISKPYVIKKIKGMGVRKIELYYSDYPKNFNMDILNKKRLISLFLIAHELFYNSSVKWKFIKQTSATSKNVYNMF